MRLSKETSLFKHDAIAEDLQGVLQTVSNNYTSKSAGVSRSHRIYYRSNSSTKPNPPTTAILGNQAFWVTESGNQYATTGGSSTVMTKWSTKITPMAEDTMAGRTKYIYLWTCEQYQMADGNYYATAVLVDESNVVIDGGNLVAGSVTANEINATNLHVNAANIDGTLTANQINATNLHVNAANIDGTLTASQINATNLHVNAANIDGTLTASQINATNLHVNAANIDGSLVIGKVDGLSDALEDAENVAKNFIELDGDGIKVHKVTDANNYAKIDSNGLMVYQNGSPVATFGSTVALRTSGTGASRGVRVAKLYGDGLYLTDSSDVQLGGFGIINKSNGYPDSCYVDFGHGSAIYLERETGHIPTGYTPDEGAIDIYVTNTRTATFHTDQSLEVKGDVDCVKIIADNLQSGSTSFASTAAGNTRDVRVSFSPQFQSIPNVVVGFQVGSGSTLSDFGSCSVAVISVTTSAVEFRLFNDSGHSKSPTINWIAVA